MLEIVVVIGLSALVIYAVTVGGAWAVHGRGVGPHQRAAFTRWAGYSAALTAAVVGWVVAGIAAFLSGGEFWRGAWAGGSAVLWLGYAPTLVWVIRVGREHEAAARVADAGLPG